MDFDIGNLVYIVLTIIFLIVGALGQKKKSNPESYDSFDEEQPNQENPLNNLERRFNTLFEDEEEESDRMYEESEARRYEPSDEREPAYLLDTPYDKLDDLPPEYNKVLKDEDSKEIYKLEDHVEEIARNTRLSIKPAKKKDVSFVKKALKDFDPRKAYLYSEIFNPKYF